MEKDMKMNEFSNEYRACASDKGDLSSDYGKVRETYLEAQRDLSLMGQAKPSYDEFFIEKRCVSDWERM